MLKKILQFLALFLLLVVLPAGSWYYLSRGMEYRRTAIRELTAMRAMSPLTVHTLKGDTIDEQVFNSAATIVGELNLQKESSGRVATELGKIHEQFDARKDVLFLLLVTQADSSSLSTLLKEHKLDDPDQVFLADRDHAPDFGFREVDKAGSSAFVAVLDTVGQVRQYYDFRDGSRVKRLVEHITILKPIIDREQAVLKRENEM
jgi:hypothetical protein